MHERPHTFENTETRFIKLQEEFDMAAKNAFSENELLEINKFIEESDARYFENGLRTDDDKAKLEKIENDIQSRSFFCKTLVEFKDALSFLEQTNILNNETSLDCLSHENAHMNMAESMGESPIGYVFIFIKDVSGEIITIQPAALFSIDDDQPVVKYLEKKYLTLSAPEIYGNNPSGQDIAETDALLEIASGIDPDLQNKLENIKNDLKNLYS